MILDLEALLDQKVQEPGIWDLPKCSPEEGQAQEQKIWDLPALDLKLQGLEIQDLKDLDLLVLHLEMLDLQTQGLEAKTLSTLSAKGLDLQTQDTKVRGPLTKCIAVNGRMIWDQGVEALPEVIYFVLVFPVHFKKYSVFLQTILYCHESIK